MNPRPACCYWKRPNPWRAASPVVWAAALRLMPPVETWLQRVMKVVACLTLLASVVHAGLLRRRQVCPQVCDASQCFDLAPACDYGQVKDECGCCVVCAAGEGQVCGDGSSTSLPCGDGLRCDSVLGTDGSLHSACVCTSSGPVCGSDGRTYPSICRLRAENSRAQSSGTPPLIFIQRGHCDSGTIHFLLCEGPAPNL